MTAVSSCWNNLQWPQIVAVLLQSFHENRSCSTCWNECSVSQIIDQTSFCIKTARYYHFHHGIETLLNNYGNTSPWNDINPWLAHAGQDMTIPRFTCVQARGSPCVLYWWSEYTTDSSCITADHQIMCEPCSIQCWCNPKLKNTELTFPMHLLMKKGLMLWNHYFCMHVTPRMCAVVIAAATAITSNKLINATDKVI